MIRRLANADAIRPIHCFTIGTSGTAVPNEMDVAEAALRACDLVALTIATLLWSAMVACGQTPAGSTAAPQPSSNVESRWPDDQSAEHAPPIAEPGTALPSEGETPPAARDVQPVQPEARKAEPDARPVEPAPKPAKPTTTNATVAPAPAAKKVKTRHTQQKIVKPKTARRAKAPSPPRAGATQPDGMPPFGVPFGSTPFAGTPLGAEFTPTSPTANTSSTRAIKPSPKRAAKGTRTRPVRANKTPPNKPAALLEPKFRPLYSLSNCDSKFSAACVLAAAA
jgi:hypothetical protein